MTYKKALVAINIYEDMEHVIASAKAIAHKLKLKLDVMTVIDNAAEFVPAAMDFQKKFTGKCQTKTTRNQATV